MTSAHVHRTAEMVSIPRETFAELERQNAFFSERLTESDTQVKSLTAVVASMSKEKEGLQNEINRLILSERNLLAQVQDMANRHG